MLKKYSPYLLLTALLTHGLPAPAQSNFVEGYVVTTTGDTLKGYIDNQDWARTPSRVDFRRSAGEAAQPYDPHQAASFYIQPTGELFEAKKVSMDKSPTQLSKMIPNAPPVVVQDTVFLKTLTRGKVSLYYYRDEAFKTHYYLQKEAQPEELVLKRGMNDQRELVVTERYRGLLAYYLGDCPSLQKQIAAAPFKGAAFFRLVSDYYQCTGSRPEYVEGVERMEKIKLEVGITGGITTSGMRIKGGYYGQMNFGSTTFPAAGVSFNLVMPRNLSKWSFYNEMTWKRFAGRNRETPIATRNQYYFDLAYLKLISMVRYQHPGAKVKPYVNAGIANAYALRLETNAMDGARKYEQSLIGGIGATMKRLSAEVRFERGNGTSPFSAVSSATRTFSFLLNYRLTGR